MIKNYPLWSILLGFSLLTTICVLLSTLCFKAEPFAAIFSLVVLLTLLRSMTQSVYLKLFIAVYAVIYFMLEAVALLETQGQLGPILHDYLPPRYASFLLGGFVLLLHSAGRWSKLKGPLRLIDLYFDTKDSTDRSVRPFSWLSSKEAMVGRYLLGANVVLSLAYAGLILRINFWYRDLFNAIQSYDAEAFWFQILWVFVPLASANVILQILMVYLSKILELRWRRWLTGYVCSRWLNNDMHYRLSIKTQTVVDNPDQRIQNDIPQFIQNTKNLSMSLMSNLTTLCSFVVILWMISGQLVLPFMDHAIPGLLIWVVLVYALIGTFVSFRLGRALTPIEYQQECYEANLRFSLASIRLYGAEIALLNGSKAEIRLLNTRVYDLAQNFISYVERFLKLTGFNLAYEQMSMIIPLIVAFPAYFAKRVQFGTVQQIVNAFTSVRNSLSFFADNYSQIASYLAVYQRLEMMLSSLDVKAIPSGNAYAHRDQSILKIKDLKIYTPDQRNLLNAPHLGICSGERVVLMGGSGSGKSTLLRVLAGKWPYYSGTYRIQKGVEPMILTQAPYFPSIPLLEAILYPYPERRDSLRNQVIHHMQALGLEHLLNQIDATESWNQRLSNGERQKLSWIRALIAKPKLIFLDEATSALTTNDERSLYTMLIDLLPESGLLSVAHRQTVVAFHDHVWNVTNQEGNVSRVEVREL